MSAETKQRILAAAERLFAEYGYAGTSLRQITAEANVNLAAVNYHFKSKEALLDALIARRAEPVNRERLELLDRLEEPTIEQVLDALLAPPMRVVADPRGNDFARVMGRVMGEGAVWSHVLNTHFGEVMRRFTAAAAKAAPHLTRDELRYRVHLMVGVMSHVLRSAEEVPPNLPRVIAFLAAGFRAPAVRAKEVRR